MSPGMRASREDFGVPRQFIRLALFWFARACPNANKGLFQAVVTSDFPLDKFALLARLAENASACPLWRFMVTCQPKPPTGRRLIQELKQTAIGPLHVRLWSHKAKQLGWGTLEAMAVAPRQIGRGIVVDG
jgi:hypothetical protein